MVKSSKITGTSIRIIHCSDIHLDRRFNLGDSQRSQKRKKDIENNFKKIIDFTIKKNADLLILGGDVFDRVNPSNSALSFLVSQIRRLKDNNIETVMIGGNHDIPKMGARTLAIDILEHAGIATVFSDTEKFQEKIIRINGVDVQIVGKSYNLKNQSVNPFSNYNVTKTGKYLICILHASFVGSNVGQTNSRNSQYNPFGIDDISDDIDYLALGHVHDRFDRKKSDTLICYPGSIERLGWNESESQKGFAIVDLPNGNKRRLQFKNLKSREFKSKEITLDKEIENINEYILEQLSDVKNPETILRLILKGTITYEQHQTFKKSELVKNTKNILFHLDIKDNFEVERSGVIFLGDVDHSPSKTFETFIESRLEKTSTPAEKKFLNQVRQIGMRYLGSVQK